MVRSAEIRKLVILTHLRTNLLASPPNGSLQLDTVSPSEAASLKGHVVYPQITLRDLTVSSDIGHKRPSSLAACVEG